MGELSAGQRRRFEAAVARALTHRRAIVAAMEMTLRTVMEATEPGFGIFRIEVVPGPDADPVMLFRVQSDGHIEQGAGWNPTTLRAVADWLERMGIPGLPSE